MMYNLIKQCNRGWKMTPFRINWSPMSPIFTMIFSLPLRWGFCGKMKNQWRSLYSVLICKSTLCFLATGDVDMSWLAHRALTRLCQQQSVCKPHRQSARAGAEADQFTPVQTGLKRERDNKRNKARGEANGCSGFASNESHATTNLSLIAHLQNFYCSLKKLNWGKNVCDYTTKFKDDPLKQDKVHIFFLGWNHFFFLLLSFLKF